jgi:hypothetical protein
MPYYSWIAIVRFRAVSGFWMVCSLLKQVDDGTVNPKLLKMLQRHSEIAVD